MMAAIMDHIDVVKLLIDNGANVNVESTSSSGRLNALIIAARNGCIENIKFLIDKGANIESKDK